MAESFAQPWFGVRAGRPDGARRVHPAATVASPGESLCLSENAGEDFQLAVDAAAGDAAAFDRLVERYAPRIYAHVFRLVQNREEAEDLTQETFLRIYRHLNRFDPTRSFKSWIYKIATNAGLNALRSRRRRGIHVPLEANDAVSTPDSQRDLRDELMHAVNALAPQPGMLVHLHYREGLSIREAAEVVGMNEGAAKVALHRARKQLRELIIEARREDV